MRLTEIAIKRPAFITMVFVALAVLGIYSYNQMGVDLLPKTDWPIVTVVTVYPGAGPKEVENDISKPLEDGLSSLNNIDNIRSYSRENVSIVVVQFGFSTDLNTAVNDVQRNVDMIRATLPKEAEAPKIQKADLNSFPIVRVSAEASMEPTVLYQFIKDRVQPALEQVPGVATINLVGGKQREIRVEVENSRLRAYNISLMQVAQALGADNLDFPAGTITDDNREFTVRLSGKFQTLDQLRNMVIASTSQGVVHLSDIADVKDTYKKTDQTFSRIAGMSAIGLIIQKTSDANSVQTSDGVQKELKNLEKVYSDRSLKFTVAQDITSFTRNSISEVKRDLGLAILMVAITLFLFLHSVRNSLIVLLSIPTSLVSTFVFMYAMGFTINLVSTMGLALVIGILVDDSIVVLENIHRHMEKGENKKTAAINGRSEIGFAAIAITLVDVVVFLPIAMVGGLVGKIFREFGLTIVVSTLISLFVSFTLTPMLASKWSKLTNYDQITFVGRFIIWFENFQKRLDAGYRKLLDWALGKRKTVLAISGAALLISLLPLPLHLIGSEFMTQADRGEFALIIEMPVGTPIEKTDATIAAIENQLKKDPNIEQYFSTVGMSEQMFSKSTTPNLGQIQIRLVPSWKRKVSTGQEMAFVKSIADNYPGVAGRASVIGMWGTANYSPLEVEIQGADLSEVVAASQQISDVMAKTDGVTDVKSTWENARPELQVVVDREKAASFGLTLGDVAAVLQTAVQGNVITKYSDNGTDYDVRLQLAERDRNQASDLGTLTLMTRTGRQIYLNQIADVISGNGPVEIDRKDRERLVTILGNLTGSRSLGDATRDIQAGIASLNLPPRIRVFFGGDNENMSDMFRDMMLALGMAVLFVYMIMVSLFESYAHPFTIMFSLPVALVGGFVALFLTGQTLNTFSMIGLIMSMGLVTKNAILLVDYTNTLRSRGYRMIDAILEAGPTRLRPIIMTTATMVLGMLPLALGLGAGSDLRQSMAIIVIGALISSTLLTLILVPVMYTYVDGLKMKFPALFREVKWLSMLKGKPRPQYAESLVSAGK
ncbi:MAG TPA: efflux RND transporter permease subunit [Candidatus Acidoferrales bacterium]|nr:efflux RND transporter permease subunit [Candidatus Acidoferrales bacterium]